MKVAGTKKGVAYEVVTACDHDKAVCTFIDKIVHGDRETCCVHKEAQDMHRMDALCGVHNKSCPVRFDAHLLVASWSCVDLSQHKHSGSVGETAETFDSILLVLDTYRFPVWIGENLSKVVKHGGEPNLELNHRLWAIDYVGEYIDIAADTKGADTTRQRGWTVAFETRDSDIKPGDARKRLQQIKELVNMFEVPPADFKDVVMSAKHPYVKQELARRLQDPSPQQDDTKWQEKMSEYIRKLGFTWSMAKA